MPVHDLHAAQQPLHDAARLGLSERPAVAAALAHDVMQAAPGVLHDEVELVLLRVAHHLSELHHGGVPRARREQRGLAQKRLSAGAHGLDGDLLATPAVAGFPHVAEGPRADLVQFPV